MGPIRHGATEGGTGSQKAWDPIGDKNIEIETQNLDFEMQNSYYVHDSENQNFSTQTKLLKKATTINKPTFSP